MIKIEGSGSISQKHGSADPDLHQNVMDPQHRLPVINRLNNKGKWSLLITGGGFWSQTDCGRQVSSSVSGSSASSDKKGKGQIISRLVPTSDRQGFGSAFIQPEHRSGSGYKSNPDPGF